MCGLVGLINKKTNGFTKQQQDTFSTLLFLDLMRGKDSTGIFSVHNNGNVIIAKDSCHSVDFMDTKEYTDVLNKTWTNGAALIGHNRKATRGEVSAENAHPFYVEDKIVLVHNGTLYGDHKKHADVAVDSHAIAHLLAKDHDAQKLVNTIDGAYALIWYDVEKERLNFLRNKERPLWWAETDDCWLWASESSMILYAAHRNGYQFKRKPSELPEYCVNHFDIKNGSWEVGDYTVTKTYKYMSSNNSRYQQGGGYWPGYDDSPIDADSCDIQIPTLVETKEVIPLPGVKSQSASMVSEAISQMCDPSVVERRLFTANGAMFLPTNVQEFSEITKEHPNSKKIFGQAVDYAYVNGRDDSDGFYLYLFSEDDDRVLFFHKFERGVMKETEVMAAVAGEYLYAATISGARRWRPLTMYTKGSANSGYISLECSNILLTKGNTISLH